MTRDRRLGRGLAALLGAPFDDTTATGGTSSVASSASAPSPPPGLTTSPAAGVAGVPTVKQEILHLNVYEIDDNPFQPRREFNEPEIASLAESLKEHDMLQPILVRQVGERYQLISGERRLRAAVRAGWSTVPARLRQADDRLVAELAIVENLQRKDLNPIEKAMSFKRYLDEHRCTQDDLAQRLKIDRSTIANLMRLLELPPAVLESVRKGELSAGHARALLPLGEEREQVAFLQRILAEELSVRTVEQQVQERVSELEQEILKFETPEKSRKRRPGAEQVSALEQQLRLALGTKVEIRQTARGRGRFVVHFANHDEFDRLFDQFLVEGSSNRRAEAG